MFFYIKNLNYILHLKQRYSSIIFTDMKKICIFLKTRCFHSKVEAFLRQEAFTTLLVNKVCISVFLKFVFLCFSQMTWKF